MKLQILVFLMLFFCITIPIVPLQAEDGKEVKVEVEADAPVISRELPSASYLQREKRSIASSVESSPLASPLRGFRSLTDSWQDPYLPGDGEWSNPGNVGAPVGDVSLPVILSILVLYLIYRGVTTSRRRNNF